MSNRKGTIRVTPLERMKHWSDAEMKFRVPAHYLEALSKGESNWTSDAVTGSYAGLLQVGYEVLDGYNKANGTTWEPKSRFNPRLNTLFCAWQLRTIADLYARSGIPELREDWKSMEWQAMLTAGWNSGYSKKAGVLKVAKWLHDNKMPVSHARIFSSSAAAGGTRHLRNPTKRRWQRGVALRSFRVIER